MKLELYERLVRAAAAESDGETLAMIAQALFEAQEAKNLLRGKGYGVTGMGIVETVAEVPDRG